MCLLMKNSDDIINGGPIRFPTWARSMATSNLETSGALGACAMVLLANM